MDNEKKFIAFYSVSKTMQAFLFFIAVAVVPFVPEIREKTRIYAFLYEFPGNIFLFSICIFGFLFSTIIIAPKLFRAIFRLSAVYLQGDTLINHTGIISRKIPIAEIVSCASSGKHHLTLLLKNGKEEDIAIGLFKNQERTEEKIRSAIDFY